ncbi:MAG: hypothetical protein DRG33_05340 [Deltaproteobacteria bacterium]|nr:MAG: hypothetical protein DRG33_05340 [Deltaproteobacteria bacterium]
MMNEVIFDEEAKKELNKKLDEISSEEKKKVELMNDIIKRTTHPHKRRNLYQSIKKIKDWRLEQTLKFHLFLSKKYSFLEGVKLSE